MEKQERGWIINFICILALLSVFAVSSLVLMNVGVHVYKNIVVTNAENYKLRTSLSYVATKIRQSDKDNGIHVTIKDDTSILSLDEEIDGIMYETLIYHYNGKVYELYQEKGTDYDVTSGLDIMELSGLEFKLVTDKLMKVTAMNKAGDSEELFIHLRTE